MSEKRPLRKGAVPGQGKVPATPPRQSRTGGATPGKGAVPSQPPRPILVIYIVCSQK